MNLKTTRKTDDVSFQHPDYVSAYNRVKTVSDLFNGVDTASQYLIKAPREETDSFASRTNGCTLKNYVKRATEAFVGMIFRKEVESIGYSDNVNVILNKVDKKSTLNKFARTLTTTLIRDGKAFLLVDTPIGGGDPYMTILDRLSVINWRKDENGMYTMLVYKEVIEEPYGEFGTKEVLQFRVFKDDGNVDIYRQGTKTSEYVLYDTIETDFKSINVIDIDLSDTPPLYDIAKLNIKHMNRTSLKDKYLDMTAIPIPVIWDSSIGIDDDDDNSGTKAVKIIGADEAFVFSGTKEEADFQWRELSGSSITALQDDLRVIEEDITSGVIRAAQSDNTTIKTATQSFYEAAESANRVTVIANAIEIALNKAMSLIVDVLGESTETTAGVIVNKDFNAITSNSDNIRILWEIYLGGALSIETFLNSMEKFELVDVGSVEEEVSRIQADSFSPISKVENTTKKIDNRTVSAMTSTNK